MPTQDNYTQRLGLAELDVYLDLPENDNTYFNIIYITIRKIVPTG